MDKNVYRTAEKYNLHLIDDSHCDNQGMPVIYGTQHVTEDLIPFSRAMTSRDFGCGVHFFIDDYRFERVWNQPERYIPIIQRFDCVLTPDFSTYSDMPLPMQRWNIYRNRALGNLWQRNGIEVIPSLSWGGEDSFDFCFDGLPVGSVLAVSTVGCTRGKKATNAFRAGMDEALRRLRPSRLIVYGKSFDCYDFSKTDCLFVRSNTMGGFDGR